MHSMNTQSIYVIIPAYNPGEIIESVVNKTFDYVDNVVIIDDGCDESNKSILESLKNRFDVTVLTHDINQGKGVAIHTGLQYCLKQGADYVIMIDSDGQHRPEELQSFLSLAQAEDKPEGLVLGVRSEIAKMPLRSKIGNVFMAKVFNFLYSQDLADTQSGYRMLSKKFAQMFLDDIPPGRYETEMQMLILAAKCDVPIIQNPITTQYFDGNKNSKFRPLQDSIRVMKSFFKYSSVGFLSFLIDYSIFLILTSFFGVYYVAAHLASRVVSGLFNYFANKKLVFKHEKSLLKSFSKYLMAVALSLGISTSLLILFVQHFGVDPKISKLIAEGMTFCLNYFVLKHFVFKQK